MTLFERKLIRVEQGATEAARRLDNLLVKLGKVGQDLRGLRQGGFGLKATIAGRVLGVGPHGFPGAGLSVRYWDGVAYHELAFFTCDSNGYYSGEVPIDFSPQSIHPVAVPQGPRANRFVATDPNPSAPTVDLYDGATATAADLPCGFAAGFNGWTGGGGGGDPAYPLWYPLGPCVFHDPVYGDITISNVNSNVVRTVHPACNPAQSWFLTYRIGSLQWDNNGSPHLFGVWFFPAFGSDPTVYPFFRSGTASGTNFSGAYCAASEAVSVEEVSP